MRRNILCALLAALIGQSAAFQPLVSRSLAHAPSLRHGILGSAPARPHFANIRGKQARGLAELRAQVEVASAIAPALNAIASGLTSVSGAAALCAVIAFHEAGHFLAARVQGIHVQDFSIGFGPTLFSTKDRDGIQYTLRALPLGGYVAFPSASEEEEEKSEEGENEASDEGKSMEERYYAPDDPDLLENRPAIQRAFVISAGVLFNMILAWGAIFGTVVTQGVSTPTLREGVLVPQIVDANGAGARFGVQAGDIILQSDDKIFPASEEGPTSLVTAVKTSKGQTMHFVIQRGGEKLTVDMTPDVNSKGEGVMGVRLTPNIERMDLVRPESPLKAASLTNREFGRAFGQTAGGLVKLVQGFAGGQGPSNLAGPVGVMQMGAEAGRQGALLTFMALISLNLGIMNSIPLPALDGGQFLLICVEAVRGKPLDQELTRTVNGLFLSMLLLVSISLLLGDIERILPANLF